MQGFFYIIVIALAGFLLIPTNNYACETLHHETNQVDNSSAMGDCQEIDGCGDTSRQCKHGTDCKGKCGNPSCHCPTNNTNFTTPYFSLPQLRIILSKPNFSYHDTFFPSGFLSIWLPPKIG